MLVVATAAAAATPLQFNQVRLDASSGSVSLSNGQVVDNPSGGCSANPTTLAITVSLNDEPDGSAQVVMVTSQNREFTGPVSMSGSQLQLDLEAKDSTGISVLTLTGYGTRFAGTANIDLEPRDLRRVQAHLFARARAQRRERHGPHPRRYERKPATELIGARRDQLVRDSGARCDRDPRNGIHGHVAADAHADRSRSAVPAAYRGRAARHQVRRLRPARSAGRPPGSPCRALSADGRDPGVADPAGVHTAKLTASPSSPSAGVGRSRPLVH